MQKIEACYDRSVPDHPEYASVTVRIFMDFLKSAVASAIAKGPLAGYSVGDRVDVESSIWTVNNVTKRVCPSNGLSGHN